MSYILVILRQGKKMRMKKANIFVYFFNLFFVFFKKFFQKKANSSGYNMIFTSYLLIISIGERLYSSIFREG